MDNNQHPAGGGGACLRSRLDSFRQSRYHHVLVDGMFSAFPLGNETDDTGQKALSDKAIRDMRRSDKAMDNPHDIDAVLNGAAFCVLSLCDGRQPYGVPLCFGVENDEVYLHSAPSGRKLDLIAKNNRVSLAFVDAGGVVASERPCSWGFRFRSVIADGVADVIENAEEKRRALNLIMAHYGGSGGVYREADLQRTAVVRVRITGISGKQSPAPASRSADV
ncbi:MAG: pyridoxamine 5'-phosphate oxidase family protein, partial [Desulfobacterales bacterium]